MSWRPDQESLQLLVLVTERGSLTAAAAELGINQPAASKRITLLERRLGVQLLVRTRQGSVLTEAGKLLVVSARAVLGEIDGLLDAASALRRRTQAHLAVAASLTIAEYLLPGWFGALRATTRELRIGLEVTNSTRVCALIRDRGVDVGFIESPEAPADLCSLPVARDRLRLVVPREHPWGSRQRPVSTTELAATPLISREPGSGTRDVAERALSSVGDPMAPPLLELGSSAAVRSSVLAGGGPALLSELVVAAYLAAGTLVAVPVAGVEFERTLRAVWRSASAPAGHAATLVDIAGRAGR